MQLFAPAKVASMMQDTGFAMDLTPTLGGIMVACAVLYAIPATTVLGAILVAGFLGGAICAHIRLGELGSPPEIISLLLGLMTWGGLYLRDPRIRAILPLIRYPAEHCSHYKEQCVHYCIVYHEDRTQYASGQDR